MAEVAGLRAGPDRALGRAVTRGGRPPYRPKPGARPGCCPSQPASRLDRPGSRLGARAVTPAADGDQNDGESEREKGAGEGQEGKELTLDARGVARHEAEVGITGIRSWRPAAEVDDDEDAHVDVGPPSSIPPVGREQRMRRCLQWPSIWAARLQAVVERGGERR